MANWKYTTIQHGARIALNLSCNDYCIADVIYKTQTHPQLGVNGWANVGCHKLGEFFDMAPGTVHKMLLRFESAGLLEFNPASKDGKRMTAKFYDIAYLDNDAVQKVNTCSQSERQGVHKVNGGCSKSEHNNIIVNKEDNINIKSEPQKTETPPTPAIPPAEKLVLECLIKAERFFEKYPMQQQAMCERARRADALHPKVWRDTLEAWIRHYIDDHNIISNIERSITKSFQAWLTRNYEANNKQKQNGFNHAQQPQATKYTPPVNRVLNFD